MRPLPLLAASLGLVPACARGGSPWEPGCAAGANVLLVTVDTLRADRLGFAGHAAARTPVIDALAARGVRFEVAVASAPITLPSHTAILTGLDPPHHGVRNNGLFSLGPERTTLAEILAARGYATAAVVGAFVLDSRYGLDQGFALYEDEMVPLERDDSTRILAQRPANAVTDAALAWLGARDPATPFFLWVHYFDPHRPYEPPPPFGGPTLEARYDGEIAFVDAELGRLLRGLGARGLADRTLLAFTADHGEGLGDHGEITHSFLLHDATMRVPLCFLPPGAKRGRVVADRQAGSVDILPTLLDLLGAPVPDGLDGESLLRPPADPDRRLYLETFAPLYAFGWSPLHALRRLGDKFVEAPSPEYYDLRADPGELRNLFSEDRAPALALRQALARRMRAEPQVGQPGAAATPGPEERARLAALGYVSDAPAPASSPAAARPDPKAMLPLFNEMLRARGLIDAKKHEEAEALLRDVLRRSPDDLFALAQLARALRGERHFEEAAAALRRALELLPTADNWVSLAEVHLELRDFDAFLEDIRAARAIEPRHGGIQLALGDGLALQGRFEEAIHAFEGAIALDPARFGGEARRKIALARERLAAASRPEAPR